MLIFKSKSIVKELDETYKMANDLKRTYKNPPKWLENVLESINKLYGEVGRKDHGDIRSEIAKIKEKVKWEAKTYEKYKEVIPLIYELIEIEKRVHKDKVILNDLDGLKCDLDAKLSLMERYSCDHEKCIFYKLGERSFIEFHEV